MFRALAEINLYQLKIPLGSAGCTISPCEIRNVPIIVRNINYDVCGCGISGAIDTFYIFFRNTANHGNQSVQGSLPYCAVSASKSLRRMLLKDLLQLQSSLSLTYTSRGDVTVTSRAILTSKSLGGKKYPVE